MRHTKTKIELYKVRTFSEKFNDTFDFIVQHWRLILRYLCIIVLPLSILQGWGLDSFFSNFFMTSWAGAYYDNAGMGILAPYAGYILFALLSSIVVTSIIYGMMQYYEDHPNGLSDLSWTDFKPSFIRALKRTGILLLAWIIASGVFVLLCVLLGLASPILVLLPFLAAMVCIVPLLLIAPTYIIGKDGFRQSVGKAWRYGWATWGGILGLIIVMGIFTYVGSGVLSIPLIICFVAKMFLVSSSDAATLSSLSSVVFTSISYLASVISAFGNAIFSILPIVALGWQYGHAAEKVDGVTVEKDVEHFDDLPDDTTQAEEPNDNITNFENL